MPISDAKFFGEGLTYDDVLLVPAYSEVLPRDTNLTAQFSRNIELKVPIVSAAMDTVTESAMAIAIARQGGIGVVHKNMSISQQANEVRKVKRSENGMIQDPVTLKGNATVGDALDIMQEHKIGGIPVVNNEKLLVGIVTNRDLRFEKKRSRPVDEVMTSENLIVTEDGSDFTIAEQMLREHRIEKLPVVDGEGKLVGLITYRDIIKLTEFPMSCKDNYGRLRVAAAVGVTSDTIERVQALVDAGVDAVIVDTAHGHSKGVIDLVKKVKDAFSQIDIVCGNVATGAAALALVEAGADAIKVGIGPGSICTTRIIAGVGMPQLSAVMNVAEALKVTDVPVIADGGVRYTGDIVKALAGGGNTVMVGSMLAGTSESPGETIIFEGRRFKGYRGMGSIEAMQKGSKDRYFQDAEDDLKKLVPEGITGRVPYKGTVQEVMYQIAGGLRAGMGYCGASNINTLQKDAQFVKITNAGMKESHPHDIMISREAPNYSIR
ncbi:MAG: IMP dehydrogenase [Bacteroidota bacterium]|nr:IMP dehydrogenase [Bacteroidota bacterium]